MTVWLTYKKRSAQGGWSPTVYSSPRFIYNWGPMERTHHEMKKAVSICGPVLFSWNPETRFQSTQTHNALFSDALGVIRRTEGPRIPKVIFSFSSWMFWKYAVFSMA